MPASEVVILQCVQVLEGCALRLQQVLRRWAGVRILGDVSRDWGGDLRQMRRRRRDFRRRV
jgi:hypothetical protein